MKTKVIVSTESGAWRSKLATAAGMAAGGVLLVSFFLWQKSLTTSEAQRAAPQPIESSAPAAALAVAPAATAISASAAPAKLELQATGSLDSGEWVAKIAVDGAAGVYLSGASLGAGASLLAIGDGEVRVQHNGMVQTLRSARTSASFGERPRAMAQARVPVSVAATPAPQPLDPQPASEEARYGAVIAQPPIGNVPALLGLQSGDTVRQINGRGVAPGDDVGAILAELEGRRVPVWIQGERNGETITLRYAP